MKNFKHYIYIVAGLVWLSACKPEINTPKPSKARPIFQDILLLVTRLTAGYADGGLYLAGQLISYPSIIAKQMQAVGGGTFKQPLFGAEPG